MQTPFAIDDDLSSKPETVLVHVTKAGDVPSDQPLNPKIIGLHNFPNHIAPRGLTAEEILIGMGVRKPPKRRA